MKLFFTRRAHVIATLDEWEDIYNEYTQPELRNSKSILNEFEVFIVQRVVAWSLKRRKQNKKKIFFKTKGDRYTPTTDPFIIGILNR